MLVLMLTYITLLTEILPGGEGGKEFCYFCINFLTNISVNFFDISEAKKKDAQSEEKPADKRGKGFRCFCMNFLAHTTANANKFDIAHRQSNCR